MTYPHDARTDYERTNSGELIAATITLGSRIDKGHPCRLSYPVLGVLEDDWYPNIKTMLAAGNFAHEFGHVDRTIADVKHQHQNQLILAYSRIFLDRSTNRDARPPELEQLGTMAVDIWADRECSAEANSLLYLREKAAKGFVSESLITRIAKNIELNARQCSKAFGPKLLMPIMKVKK